VDLVLNLRYPTAGETSASLLRVMAMGVPVVVPQYRQYLEIPRDSCLHLALGEEEDIRLTKILGRLASDEKLRLQLGRNARKYVLELHTLEESARGYKEFLDEMIARERGQGKQMAKPTRWRGLTPRPPAGSGPCRGDDYRRNSRVPGLLKASINVLDRFPALSPGESCCVRLKVTNCGDTVWLAEAKTYGGYVVAAARVYDTQGRLYGEDQQWQRLSRDVFPGRTIEINYPVNAPRTPGRYTLRFDLHDVGICWFSEENDSDTVSGFDFIVG